MHWTPYSKLHKNEGRKKLPIGHMCVHPQKVKLAAEKKTRLVSPQRQSIHIDSLHALSPPLLCKEQHALT